jgi:hypothetical protein
MSNVSQFIGSGWVPLETIEVTSAVANVNFDSNIDDTFNNYVITGTHTLTTTASIYGRLKTGDPSATIDTGYRALQTSPGFTTNTTNTNSIVATLSYYSGSFVAYFMNLRSSDAFKSIVSQGTGYIGAQMYVREFTNALIDTSIINGIQILLSTGSISTGKFTLYGIKEL